MSVSVLYMSMSLDGYIADQGDRLGGDDGNRLHKWFLTPKREFFRPSGPAGALVDELNATGAVLVGRRTAEIVDIGLDHLDYNAHLGDWSALAATAERMQTLVRRM